MKFEKTVCPFIAAVANLLTAKEVFPLPFIPVIKRSAIFLHDLTFYGVFQYPGSRPRPFFNPGEQKYRGGADVFNLFSKERAEQKIVRVLVYNDCTINHVQR